jgi:hypothetical protein
MMKMKIIDLLNKIANGEEVPKKIYCFNREFYLKENTYFGDTFTLMHYIQEEDLNDEVEIIEEEKKIPERVLNAEVFDVPKLNNMELSNIALTNKEDIKIIKDTLNKVLDYLKSKGE